MAVSASAIWARALPSSRRSASFSFSTCFWGAGCWFVCVGGWLHRHPRTRCLRCDTSTYPQIQPHATLTPPPYTPPTTPPPPHLDVVEVLLDKRQVLGANLLLELIHLVGVQGGRMLQARGEARGAISGLVQAEGTSLGSARAPLGLGPGGAALPQTTGPRGWLAEHPCTAPSATPPRPARLPTPLCCAGAPGRSPPPSPCTTPTGPGLPRARSHALAWCACTLNFRRSSAISS